MKIPEGPQALTPEWLTAVLRESGAIANVSQRVLEAPTR